MYFRLIFALAIKEFLALLRDKRSRFIIIGPPIVQLLVFGFAATYDLNDVPVVIYNEDRGGAARELVSRIEGSPNFQVVAYIDRDSEVAPLIDNRDVLLVLHRPAFQCRADAGRECKPAGDIGWPQLQYRNGCHELSA